MQFKYAFAAIAVMAVCSATLVAAGNWAVTEMPQSVLAGISFVTSEDGSLAGGDNGIGPLVLATDNDGAGWAMGEIGNATAMILAVRRQCATNGVVAGLGIFTAGTMYTEDGKNWQNSASVAQLTTSQNVEVVPSEDCRSFGVVGSFGSKNGVGLSTDGGKTFKYLDFGGNTQARYGAFPSSKTWYVSGGTWPSSSKSGKAFGGAGSSRLDMATGRYHLTHRIAVNLFKNRVELLKDSDLPQAVNAGGNSTTYEAIVQRTDDAGQTWSNVFNMTAENNMYPNGIACGSVDVCWVTTSGDTASWIYGTTDGGATWQQQHFNNDEALMPAHALSETEAFVAGMNSQTGNGVIYHTTDGGATWELTQLGPVSPGDLSFPSNTNGYASAFTNEGVSAFLKYTSV